jgi:hypothetical protein
VNGDPIIELRCLPGIRPCSNRSKNFSTADTADASGFAAELSSLATRLRSADGELTRLRCLLGSLHERTRSARLAAS